MKIDKVNSICCYNDESHVYWDSNTNEKFTSVTTLIGEFKAPYDSDFWSGYKSLERLGVPKKSLGGLIQKMKITEADVLKFNIDYLNFKITKEDILDEWEKKKVNSCIRGTKIHFEKENEFYKYQKHTLNKYNLPGEFTCNKDYYELDLDKGVYPEYLVYIKDKEGFLNVAGQIDLLIKDGNDIIVVDYKSSLEIKQSSYFNSNTKKYTMMNFPLNNLQDCNFYHYTMQLSTYAWMIKQKNKDFKIKGLLLIHYDHDGGVTNYELDYLEDEVIAMLKYKKKQNKIKHEKSLSNKIEF